MSALQVHMIVTLMLVAPMRRLDPTHVLVRLAIEVLAPTVLVSVINRKKKPHMNLQAMC